MTSRLLSAAIGLPLTIAAVWFGGAWLLLLVALVVCFALWEFYHLATASGGQPLLPLGLLWGLALVGNGALGADYTLPVISAGVFASLAWVTARGVRPGALADWGYTLAGPLYIAWPLAHALLLRSQAQGREWLLFALLAIFATDTAAFFTGRAFGRHRMAPSISPGKTWEGTAGGLAGAVAAALALGTLLSLDVSLVTLSALGAAVGVLAQVGDLAESLLKRAAGVKDAGSLVPGHGGILDRLDSVVFGLLVVYYGLVWVVQ